MQHSENVTKSVSTKFLRQTFIAQIIQRKKFPFQFVEVRRSSRLADKVVDYRPMLGMRIPKKKPTSKRRKETRKTQKVTVMAKETNTKWIGRIPKHQRWSKSVEIQSLEKPKQNSKTSPKEITPIVLSQNSTLEPDCTETVNASRSSSDNVLPGIDVENVASASMSVTVAEQTPQQHATDNDRLFLVRTTRSLACNHRNMTRYQIMGSRNCVIDGDWVTRIRSAFSRLISWRRPYTTQDIGNAVSQTFLEMSPYQFDEAVRQLTHRVTERLGFEAIHFAPDSPDRRRVSAELLPAA
ncbi:hypothetical protein RB195_008254 [Necator americanus]|uniref:Uncharacterized protein n=1 Tax=Necator americanus TaxID=51031 RepID=A0ABR1CP75_NECAM